MPIFEYICQECHHQFEALVYGKEKAECPKCHAKKLETQLSTLRCLGQRLILVGSPHGCLRILRRPPRPRRLLPQHELEQASPQANAPNGAAPCPKILLFS